MDPKEKIVLERIKRFEEEIAKGREYLETGAHARWIGFRPWFTSKFRDGVEVPPHRDWVKNVFLPRKEKSLRNAEKLLERLTNEGPRLTAKMRLAEQKRTKKIHGSGRRSLD